MTFVASEGGSGEALMTASQEAPSSSSMQGYIPPSRDSTGFHCPNCGVYAYQWWTGTAFRAGDGSGNIKALKDVNAAFCARCEKFSLWYGNTMVHPIATNAPFPHTDLPDDGKADDEERRPLRRDHLGARRHCFGWSFRNYARNWVKLAKT